MLIKKNKYKKITINTFKIMLLKMELFILDNGKIDNEMEKVLMFGLMVQNMMECG